VATSAANGTVSLQRGAHSIAEAIGRARQPVRRRFFGLG
jgi:hypothetical protein